MGEALDAAQRFYRLFGEGDLDGAAAVFHPDCITRQPTGDLKSEEHKAYGEVFKAALPDAHMVMESAVESGDWVAIRGRFQGNHTGPLQTPMGEIPPSGNAVDMPFADFFRVEDGRAVEHHVYWDMVTMRTQVGAAPPGP